MHVILWTFTFNTFLCSYFLSRKIIFVKIRINSSLHKRSTVSQHLTRVSTFNMDRNFRSNISPLVTKWWWHQRSCFGPCWKHGSWWVMYAFGIFNISRDIDTDFDNYYNIKLLLSGLHLYKSNSYVGGNHPYINRT